MKIYALKVKKPFSSLSNHKKRDIYVQERWKALNGKKGSIHYFNYHGQQVLTTIDRNFSTSQVPENTVWLDFLLFDPDKRTIWNGEFLTVTQRAWDLAYSQAYDFMKSLITPEELIEDSQINFELVYQDGKKMYKMLDRKVQTFPSLNNQSINDFIKFKENEILKNKELDIYPEYYVDHQYKYGVGLCLIIDEKYIHDFSVLEPYFIDFLDKGRTSYTFPNKAIHLPTMTSLEWSNFYKSQKN